MTDLARMETDMLALRLRLTATLQLQMAAALIGKGQDELRKHFGESAELMLTASKAIAQKEVPND